MCLHVYGISGRTVALYNRAEKRVCLILDAVIHYWFSGDCDHEEDYKRLLNSYCSLIEPVAYTCDRSLLATQNMKFYIG